MKIESFSGTYRFLSNFWPALVTFDDEYYPSVEHAYQAAKTLDQNVRYAIKNAKTAGQAKKLGSLITDIRSDWESVKIDVMKNLVEQKFTTNVNLAQLLLDTGEAELIEGNNWGDRFWGICKGEGYNHLGKILMDVRRDLANAVKNTTI